LALPRRVRAKSARFIAELTPGLTPEFVLEHILATYTCADWLGQMLEYYEAVGTDAIAAPLADLRAEAVDAGV
jgi:hypothetical protein